LADATPVVQADGGKAHDLGGCGCRQAPGLPTLAVLALLGLFVARRRRR
jgi:hypothetical protein